jgi:hypothetical protein
MPPFPCSAVLTGTAARHGSIDPWLQWRSVVEGADAESRRREPATGVAEEADMEASGGRQWTERRRRGWMATGAERGNTEDATATSRVPMTVVGELARPAAEMQRGSAPRAVVLARRRRSPDGRRVGRRGPQESRGEGWGRLRVLELEAGVIRDLGFGRVYIPDLGDGPLAGQFNGLSLCQQVNRVVPVPALRTTMAAQALALRRVVPGTGTIDIVSCRARVVLFRTVLVPAHRARAKWPTIGRGLFGDKSDSLWDPRPIFLPPNRCQIMSITVPENTLN